MHINGIISKETVNTGRQREVDALKAFSIIMMIITHCIDDLFITYDEFAISHFINDILAQVIGAEGFMICMGIGMIYSRHAKPRDYFFRGINILIIGQVLNLFRYGLVYIVAYAVTGEELARGTAFLTFSSDILQFAGIFLIMAGLMLHLKLRPGHIFGVAVVLNVIGMALAGRIHTGSYALDQLIGLFVYTDTESYFPVLNWFIFPAFGMIFGQLLIHVEDKRRFYRLLAIPCTIVSVIYCVLAISVDQHVFTVVNDWKSFCYMRLPDACGLFFCNILVLCIWFGVTSRLSDRAMEPVKFVSSNINRYYCVHSVFIYLEEAILLFAFGSLLVKPVPCYISAVVIISATTALVWFYGKYLAKKFAAFFGRNTVFWYIVVIVLSIAVCVWSDVGTDMHPSVYNDYFEEDEVEEEDTDAAAYEVTSAEASTAQEIEPESEKTSDQHVIIDTSALSVSKPLIGVVTTEGGIEDASFNQGAWEGLQRLSGMYDCEVKFLESRAEGDFVSNLDSLIAQDPGLCWGMGYDCAGTVLEVAKTHPEISFAIVDFASDDLPDNVTCVTFRSEEASFLAGYIAGEMTETGQVGFVGGVRDEIIDQFRYGYEAGVKYAADQSGRSVEVEALYADSYSDPAKGRELALQLYDGGCDIIFQAAGETGTGVIDAAREVDRYVIGVDKDQAYLAPEHVLTSVMKYVNNAIVRISGDNISGTATGGTTVSLGLAEDAVGLSENHELYPDELYDQVLELKADIVAGRIIVPAAE